MSVGRSSISNFSKKQVWLWPYKAPGIVGSGSYDIAIVCGPRDMCLQKYILFLTKNIGTMTIIMNLYIE